MEYVLRMKDCNYGGKSAPRQKAAHYGDASCSGNRDDSQGNYVDGSPDHGTFDSDSPLQPLLRVLQRIRRPLEADSARYSPRTYRPARGPQNFDYHLERR